MNKTLSLLCLLLMMVAVQVTVLAQASGQTFYVIVGGFATEENAASFANQVHEMNYPADYSFNEARRIYYVYVRMTKDRPVAAELAKRLRQEERAFRNAWVYAGTPLNEGVLVKSSPVRDHEASRANNQVTASVEPKTVEPQPVIEEPVTVISEPKSEEPLPEVKTELPEKKEGRAFVFQLVNGSTGMPVTGNVRVVESERDTVYQSYQANEIVTVAPPKGGKLVVICNLVGYKMIKKPISYSTTPKGATTGSSQEVIVPIKLVAVKRGDYIELERVKFFEHSAIMTPESESELLELVNLMDSNPDYKIRVHGHTHSDESREIIEMGDSPDFFALSSANKTSHGSAKELSKRRAEVVKAYLVSKGVSEKRIATAGQGAMLAIYDHHGANERIEVEILKH